MYANKLVGALKCKQTCLPLHLIFNFNIRQFMKKTYISPLMTEVNVEAEAMLAASLKLDNEKTVDTSNGGQLGGENRGEWGNLWK